MEKKEKIIDEYYNEHELTGVLGQGGQGIVYRTKDPDIAIKFVLSSDGDLENDEVLLRKYTDRFKDLRLLPIPKRLPIAMPVAVLRNKVGYVMNLLSEMVPFTTFWIDSDSEKAISEEDIPDWLSEMPPIDAKKFIHYAKTGGLRRRLEVLYKSSAILARLHGSGIVYGDLSPNNMFLSESRDYAKVWLIDADNMKLENSNDQTIVYTPRFGAPELVKGTGRITVESDSFSFAIIAFNLLSMVHPFLGKRVFVEDWADDSNDELDPEIKAFEGYYPWIDDPNDRSNEYNGGLPRVLLLTPKMKSLFQKTFSEGRLEPTLRPSIYHWPNTMAKAADKTIKCRVCMMTRYYDFKNPATNGHHCPYCGTSRPRFLKLESYQTAEEAFDISKEPSWLFIREVSENGNIEIPRRVVDDFRMQNADETVLSLQTDHKDLTIKPVYSEKLAFNVALESEHNRYFQKIYSTFRIENMVSEKKIWLRIDAANSRVVKVTMVEEDHGS